MRRGTLQACTITEEAFVTLQSLLQTCRCPWMQIKPTFATTAAGTKRLADEREA
jgi:hypothetical protein